MALPGASSASASLSTSTTSTWEVSRSRSRPSTGGGGARVRGRPRLWSLIVLLLLSQSVWNTLQCTTRTAQPEIPSRDFETSTSGRGEVEMEVVDVDSEDNYFRFRRNGNETKRLCKYRLYDAIIKTCSGSVYDPSQGPSQGRSSHSKRSLMQQRLQRLPRSVVDECCNNPCREAQLRKYCQPGSQMRQKEPEPDTNVAQTTSNDEFQQRQVPEQVAPQDNIGVVPQHHQQRPEYEQEMEESGEPMLYYPILNLINLMHRQFERNNKMTVPIFVEDLREEDEQIHQGPPLPQQRIQVNHGQGHNPGHGHGQNHGLGHVPHFSNNDEKLTSASANSGANRVSASNLHNHHHHHNNGNGVPEAGSGHHHSHNQNSQFPFRTILQGDQGQGQSQSQGQGAGSSEDSRRPTGTGQNAVTATLPPYIFSIVPGTNDYI